MKNLKKTIARLMAGGLLVALVPVTAYAGNSVSEDEVYVPTWMEAGSVIVYDEDLNCTVVEGGELDAGDIEGRDDIAAVGFESRSEEMLATPNTKVEYDSHGFIQNVYHLVPGTVDEYQLSGPSKARKGSGVMDAGTSHTYGSYMNYDTGKTQSCKLTRSKDGKTMTGTGRITYFTGEYGEAGSHKLVAYDCATKMDYDDVKGGTEVTAKNTYADKSQTYAKYDVGSLPKAILDIWSDGSVNPIKDITTNGKVDNVYSGRISHKVVLY